MASPAASKNIQDHLFSRCAPDVCHCNDGTEVRVMETLRDYAEGRRQVPQEIKQGGSVSVYELLANMWRFFMAEASAQIS